MWLKGLAGSGKTTIAHTIASWCDRTGRLGASFFCARTGGRREIHRIFPTIAHQLAVSNLAFAKEVIKAAEDLGVVVVAYSCVVSRLYCH